VGINHILEGGLGTTREGGDLKVMRELSVRRGRMMESSTFPKGHVGIKGWTARGT
jgi:hypothetical protein